ncbi:transposase [Calothrix brevissima NIES-22]|nr:transposase [Calothrix brevissima NIES-22]
MKYIKDAYQLSVVAVKNLKPRRLGLPCVNPTNRRKCWVSFLNLNGSLNILRKVVRDSIFDRNSVERLVVSPVRFRPYEAKNI